MTHQEDPSGNRESIGANWYEDWFDREEYELVYSHRDTIEAERLNDLIERVAGLRKGDQMLDIGCGRGRHAISMARRGYVVTGLDLSARAIATARERARLEEVDVRFVEGDMREPLCEACFDGVTNLFTAFGYFERDEEHEQAILAMATSLRSGGWIIQDFLNASLVQGEYIAEDRRVESGVEIIQRRRLDDGRIVKEIALRRGNKEQVHHESVRLLTLDDFRRYYANAGLRLLNVYGDYDGGPHDAMAPRLILHAVKP
jgi:SAM-dependent methyltransferase